MRENNVKHGPGKNLLHGQYLHRESILINDELVEAALQQNRCAPAHQSMTSMTSSIINDELVEAALQQNRCAPAHQIN